MIIRKAIAADTLYIVSCILLAMEEIVYRFIGEADQEKAMSFLMSLVAEPGNQYSYGNCFVAEENNQILGAALVYNGAQLQELRAPVIQTIKSMFDKSFLFEEETQAGEYYIDCIGVNPVAQGKGIGTKLLQFLIEEFVEKRNETLGLLVDRDNPNAKKLYLKLGFKIIGEKAFAGKQMEHLQVKKFN